ncbi:glycine zipper family protein [Pedobacter yulinensis]|uniref:Glycine zipper family protein n=2 Tax=Pedobacter yulinensis TaxID=2126353 RepID=A0A2T3HN73_9SPHI|nr:glycine zipper family protein [Pedobacter yulinensis]
MTVWMPLGIAMGLPFGVVFKNIALGLPIGMATGSAIAGFLNARAKSQGLIVPE